MPDEFGPRIEADAYRVTLWIERAPHEAATKTILRVGDDASVSFAKHWIAEEQPDTCIGQTMFDRWVVEKFYTDHVYRPIATGEMYGGQKRKQRITRSFRGRQEARDGATEIRNGVWALNRENAQRDPVRRRFVAGRSGRKGRPARKKLTPFQERIAQMKADAKRQIAERGRANGDLR